jgi:hypothetical protein
MPTEAYAHGGLCPRRPMPTEAYAHGGLCPMPTEAYALCPMPYALCPMPYALCPMHVGYLMLLRKAIFISVCQMEF